MSTSDQSDHALHKWEFVGATSLEQTTWIIYSKYMFLSSDYVVLCDMVYAVHLQR